MGPFTLVDRKRLIAWLLLLPLIMVIVAGFDVPAQALTYTYVGQGFSISQCQTSTGYSAPPCVDGSLTGSVTFTGIPSGYSGTADSTYISSWNMNASNVGSLGTGGFINTGATIFYFSSGQLNGWTFQAWADSSNNPPGIVTINNGGYYDAAYNGTPPAPGSTYAFIQAPGTWMGHRDIASTMVYLKGVRNRDIQARLNKGSLAAFA